MDVYRKDKFSSLWRSCLTALVAMVCLPVAAQDAAAEEGADETELRQQHGGKAARHARAAHAKVLAASLADRGMDPALAFQYAYVAVLAEEQGKGRAEEVLARLVKEAGPAALIAMLSESEFAELLCMLDEQRIYEQSTASSTAWEALLKRLATLLENDRTPHFGAAGSGGCRVASHWAQSAQAYRGGNTMPSVWWLENHSGSILHHEPAMPMYMPPGAPAGNLHRRKPDKKKEGQQIATTALDDEDGRRVMSLSAAASAQSLTSAPAMASAGGAGGGGFALRASAPLAAAPLDGAPDGEVTWTGKPSDLQDGAVVKFNSTGKNSLDVAPADVWRPSAVIVDDSGITMTNRAPMDKKSTYKVGYAFNGSGSIGDYEGQKTTLTKKGNGILVLANAGNTYSGGTDVQGGTVYVADQGALGTGAVTMHDGTAMWVNYSWNKDFSSSFRNPSVSNTIKLSGEVGQAVSATVSYGNFPYQKVLGNDSSRIWRNLYLTGGITGDANSHLFLQSYNSRYGAASAKPTVYTAPRLHIGGTINMREELWYGGFVLNRAEALTKDDRFEGTLTLGNRVNTSGDSGDNLAARETGAVKLTLSDDVLEYATLDATREWQWVTNNFTSTQIEKEDYKTEVTAQNELLLKGTVGGVTAAYTVSVSDPVRDAHEKLDKTSYTDFATYGLLQTHSNTILISDNTKIGELKADLLGVTQDSYRDVINWSEQLEVGMVRVATLENSATLTLGKKGSTTTSWFSGTVGFENLLCDMDGDGKDTLNKANMNGLSSTPTTKAGVSLVKVGDNTQYIHSAKLHNLDVRGGTLGFNNVNLVNNLTLASGAKLQLGVQNEQWKDAGSVSLQVGETETGAHHRLAVVTNRTDETYADAPFSARVEGSLKLNASTEIAFEVNALGQESGERDEIVPAWLMEDDTFRAELKKQAQTLSDHSLLQVTAATQRTDADKGGVLTLNNASPISLAGVNFLSEQYENKVYFLAAADKIEVDKNGTIGTASDFDARVITLGYGYYGLISAIDGHGTTIGGEYKTYDTDHDFYLDQDYLVLRVAADPTRSWTGSGTTSSDHAANVWTAAPDENYTAYLSETGTGQKPDAQWKENRAYTDGVSVKFGNLWMPTTWEEYLAGHQEQGATLQDYEEKLNSSQVTKVGETLFSDAPISEEATRTPNGTEVTYGGLSYGTNGSTYDPARTEEPSRHFEQVVIEGMVRPGYVTINSDFNLKTENGSYVTVKDDTNYVFTGSGWIADASAETMQEIYKNQLGEGISPTILNDWKTGLAKGGTGTLVMETQNTYSGGTLLQGGLTVMKNMWALGMENPTANFNDPDPAKRFAAADAKGGSIEMSYGAGLMADYITEGGVLDQIENTIRETVVTNDLTITHMADFDNTGATGDAQLFNRYDTVMVVHTLSSYDDAILTLRGVSLAADDERAHKEGDKHTYYTFGEYMIASPENAYGTIRMAGYLQGTDGALVDPDGDAYMNGGGKVQLTLTGHTSSKIDHPHWSHTTIDLSLNGGSDNVLALDTRFIANDNSTAAVENTEGKTLYVFLGTLKDDGDSGHHARVINDASSERLGDDATTSYVVNLTLSPNTDAAFSGDVGFGIGQNGAGAALPSRGYISLTKTGAAAQSIGNARLLDLKVEGTGLMHFNENLSARSIATTNVGAQHIHVGSVEDAAMSHTLTVGKGGVLSFDTTLDADPLAGLKSTESDTKYGKELSYVLLKDGATITGSGNWNTAKGIAVAGGASITFNTHDYSMDETVSATMDVYGPVGTELKEAFDDSHIFWLKEAVAGDKVTLNLVNEQMSAGATKDERGQATSNGYIITHDLNEYASSSGKVTYGLQGNSTVNIGAKTILQSYVDAKTDSGIAYNVTGTDAALQFLENGTGGYKSYVHDATLAEGGCILFGGASVATSANNVNTDKVDPDITKGTDVVITNKEGGKATVQNVTHTTANTAVEGVTYETTIGGTTTVHATVDGAVLTAQGQSAVNKTLVKNTDFTDSMVKLQDKCSVTLEDVVVSADSKVEGAGPASGTAGAAAVFQGATAASDQDVTAKLPSNLKKGSVTLTNDATRINTTLTNVQNVVKNDVLIQVTKADQLSRTDVGGKGLTLGLTQETLEKATAAGARYLAIQVSDSGRFLYEKEAVLESIKLTDHNGATYINPAYDYKVVSSKDVADFIGVEQSQISDTLLYIEVSETPEPTTSALSLLALAALTARRRRK